MEKDLDLATVCAISQLSFVNVKEYDFPIVGLKVSDACSCAILLKKNVCPPSSALRQRTHQTMEIVQAFQDHVVMQHQELHLIPASTIGGLYLLEAAAFGEGYGEQIDHKDHTDYFQEEGDILTYARTDSRPMSIWALTVADDSRVRWFWTARSSTAVLGSLEKMNLVSTAQTAEPGTTLHAQLFTTIKMLFQQLTDLPDSADWKRAEQMTDYAPDIEDPDGALMRLINYPYLYHNAPNPARDNDHDRYFREVHAAEAHVASVVDMKISQYMLFKREYFKEFYKDIRMNRGRIPVPLRIATRRATVAEQTAEEIDQIATPGQHRQRNGSSNDDFTMTGVDDTSEMAGTPSPTPGTAKVKRRGRPLKSTPKLGRFEKDPNRVRTDTKHIEKIRAAMNGAWTWTQARLLMESWKVLGFLNEEFFVDWVDNGGMFENIGDQYEVQDGASDNPMDLTKD